MSNAVSDPSTREREDGRARAVVPSAPAQRVVGTLLLGAGALALAGNLLHPRYSGPEFIMYERIARSTRYVAADLLLLPALLLLTVGLAGLARRGSGSAADIARVTAIVGGCLAIAQLGVELQAVRQQARIFAAAGPKDLVGAFWSTNAIDRLNGALTGSWIVLLLGLTPLLLAAGQVTVNSAQRGLALVGCAGGALCMGVGTVDLLSQDQGRADLPFLIGSLLITAWVLITGYLLVRARDARVG